MASLPDLPRPGAPKKITPEQMVKIVAAERPILKYLESIGLKLYFLPPYSPELNRIERLWHKMIYTWMAPKCRNSKELEADVDDMLKNFGTKFEFAF